MTKDSQHVNWVVRRDDMDKIPEHLRPFVLLYEYMLSDEWENGTPAVFFEEIRAMKKRKKAQQERRAEREKKAQEKKMAQEEKKAEKEEKAQQEKKDTGIAEA